MLASHHPELVGEVDVVADAKVLTLTVYILSNVRFNVRLNLLSLILCVSTVINLLCCSVCVEYQEAAEDAILVSLAPSPFVTAGLLALHFISLQFLTVEHGPPSCWEDTTHR